MTSLHDSAVTDSCVARTTTEVIVPAVSGPCSPGGGAAEHVSCGALVAAGVVCCRVVVSAVLVMRVSWSLIRLHT